MKFIVHTDGGARGNPGPAAIGVVIEKCQMPLLDMAQGKNAKCQIIAQWGKKIGETTNNVAEYKGVIEALRHLRSSVQALRSPDVNEKVDIHFSLDSTLVVNQLNGTFKVKDARLRELLAHVRILEQEIGGTIFYSAIPREQNARADALVNEALDAV